MALPQNGNQAAPYATDVVSGRLSLCPHPNAAATGLCRLRTDQPALSHGGQNTEFDLFVIQVPDAPFGLSWYQGGIETNGRGRASETFVGRFNIETFIVAPGGGSRADPA